MQVRAEITRKYAKAYRRASKKDKGRMPSEVCAVTGWSRDNARRRLTAAGSAPARARVAPRRSERRARARKYSYDALVVLQRVWASCGYQCGKYLVVSMPVVLDLLEAADELDDEARDGPQVRGELEAMSAATIDRYLKPARERARVEARGLTATKAGRACQVFCVSGLV